MIIGIKSNCILQYAQNVLNILKKSNISPEQSRLASQLALHLQSPSASQSPRSLQSLSVLHLKPEENWNFFHSAPIKVNHSKNSSTYVSRNLNNQWLLMHVQLKQYRCIFKCPQQSPPSYWQCSLLFMSSHTPSAFIVTRNWRIIKKSKFTVKDF